MSRPSRKWPANSAISAGRPCPRRVASATSAVGQARVRDARDPVVAQLEARARALVGGAFELVAQRLDRVEAARVGVLDREALRRQLGAQLERPRADDDGAVRLGRDRLPETVVADVAPRAREVGEDVDGDLGDGHPHVRYSRTRGTYRRVKLLFLATEPVDADPRPRRALPYDHLEGAEDLLAPSPAVNEVLGGRVLDVRQRRGDRRRRVDRPSAPRPQLRAKAACGRGRRPARASRCSLCRTRWRPSTPTASSSSCATRPPRATARTAVIGEAERRFGVPVTEVISGVAPRTPPRSRFLARGFAEAQDLADVHAVALERRRGELQPGEGAARVQDERPSCSTRSPRTWKLRCHVKSSSCACAVRHASPGSSGAPTGGAERTPCAPRRARTGTRTANGKPSGPTIASTAVGYGVAELARCARPSARAALGARVRRPRAPRCGRSAPPPCARRSSSGSAAEVAVGPHVDPLGPHVDVEARVVPGHERRTNSGGRVACSVRAASRPTRARSARGWRRGPRRRRARCPGRAPSAARRARCRSGRRTAARPAGCARRRAAFFG